MAKLTFYGATNGVTGSMYLIESENSKVLLECGMVQGRHEDEKQNYEAFPFKAESLDAVILSHAHIDHSGRLPKLIADGYKGKIFMTAPTLELLGVMLKDAAFLELRDTEWENKRRKRAGQKLVEPLYTIEDVEQTLSQSIGENYKQEIAITEDISICFNDAGHILGSAIVEVFINENNKKRKLVFTGDLGNSCAALLKDPAIIEYADTLLLESTYGDRDHRPMDETLNEFEGIIQQAADKGGNVLIPSFAVGRTQEIIFRLGEMYHAGTLTQQAVYLDSPMAISATEIYQRYQSTFSPEDADIMEQTKSDSLESFLPVLRFSRTTEESMALNRIQSGAIIIAGSGMCSGGRIRHHFKHNLWRKNTHVIIVGFQAAGTPGRAMVDGSNVFKLGGDEITIKANVHTLGGFSAHASQSQLLSWVSQFQNKPKIYLIHGEDEAKQTLEQKLKSKNYQVSSPGYGNTIKV